MEQGHISFLKDFLIFNLLRKSKLFSEIAIVLLDFKILVTNCQLSDLSDN